MTNKRDYINIVVTRKVYVISIIVGASFLFLFLEGLEKFLRIFSLRTSFITVYCMYCTVNVHL